MKLESLKLEDCKIKKNEMITIKGGTSTTVYTQVGICENEYEDTNGNGKLDDDEAKKTPTLMGCD